MPALLQFLLRLIAMLVHVRRAPALPDGGAADAWAPPPRPDDAPEPTPPPPVEVLVEGEDLRDGAEEDVLAPLVLRSDGWLDGEGVKVLRSERDQRLATTGARPAFLLWHWTATAHGTGPSLQRRIVKKPGPSSWGTLITERGDLLCSVPANRGSWHAGGATAARFYYDPADARAIGGWVMIAAGEKAPKGRPTVSANAISHGIEMVNVGEVRCVRLARVTANETTAWLYIKARPDEDGAVWMGWPYGAKDKRTGKLRKGPVVRPEDVLQARDRHGVLRHYQRWTRAQEEAAERLVRAYVDRYGMVRRQLVVGHWDVDPGRKADPGPIWYNGKDGVLDRILDRVLPPGGAS